MPETDTNRTTQRGGAAFAAWGPSDVDLHESADQLRALGLPPLLNPAASVGGGGYARLGRWLVGGFGEGGGAVTQNARHLATYGYGSGWSFVGFTLLHALGLTVAPVVGLGGAGFAGQTRDAGAQIVDDQAGGGGGGLVMVGVLVEFHLGLWRGYGPLGGLLLGWRTGAFALSNASSFNLPRREHDGVSGFFARAVVGLGRGARG